MSNRTLRVALAGALVAAMTLAGCPSVHHTISGKVSGAIADGVLVTLTQGGSTTTFGGGRYELSGLASGRYTVSPSLEGYTFTPTSLAITVQGSDVSGADFVAVALPGTLDVSFGEGGTTRTAFPDSRYAYGYALAIQPDGKLVVAGDAYGPPEFALARYAPDGALDAAFGTGGLVVASLGLTSPHARAVAVQPDGYVVAAGVYSPDPTSQEDRFVLARLAPDGALDPAFGAGGVVTTAFPRGYAAATSVALQPDGKIVAAGVSLAEIALARYAPDGALDPSFGAQGLVTTSFAPGSAGAHAVVIQPDGKIVVTGGGVTADGSGFLLARFDADGTLDAGFGQGGVALAGPAEIYTDALALQPDGKIVVAGYRATPGPGVNDPILAFALARYLPDGTLDASFGDGGKVSTAVVGKQDVARAVAIQGDGKIVAAGSAYVRGTGYLLALARYRGDGTLDTTFGTGGSLTVDVPAPPSSTGVISQADAEAMAIAIQPDGRLVVAGSSNFAFVVARFWP